MLQIGGHYILSINPDSCDFWSKVDHASREENRKKQELLRNGGQS